MLSSHLLTNHGWKMVPHLAKPVAEAPLIARQSCKCPVCNVSLKDAKRLEKHINKAHPERPSSSHISSNPSKKNSVTTISYQWAITQPLDKKYSAVVEKFVTEKTLSEIEKEIVTIVNGYDAADTSRQSLMSGRLILLAHAKKRLAAKSKSSKNKKVAAKGKKNQKCQVTRHYGPIHWRAQDCCLRRFTFLREKIMYRCAPCAKSEAGQLLL